MTPSKAERVAEVLKRFEGLPPSATYDEIRAQLARVVNEVEDELTPFPYDPDDLKAMGRRRPTNRIYPVQDDNIEPLDGHPQVMVGTTRGEFILFGSNGAVEIRDKKDAAGRVVDEPSAGAVKFKKAGRDGRHVWDL